MAAQKKFPIPYDWFKAIVAILLLIAIILLWPLRGPAPTLDVAVDPSGVVTFSGEGKPGSEATITLRSADGAIQKITTIVDDTGRWLGSLRLPPGNYTATVDVKGRKSAPKNFEVPESAALEEISVGQSSDNPYILKGRASAGQKLLLFVDGQKVAEIQAGEDGEWSYQLAAEPGNHTVQLAYANTPEITSDTLTIKLPPATPQTPVIEEVEQGENGAVSVSGRAAPNTKIYLWIDGKLEQTVEADDAGNWVAAIQLPPGEHELRVGSSADLESASAPTLIKVEKQEEEKRKEEPASNDGFPYIVKEGDWLTKLARDYLGSEERYEDIRNATNSKADVDDSFDRIEDDNLIYPGEKIWIPQK